MGTAPMNDTEDSTIVSRVERHFTEQREWLLALSQNLSTILSVLGSHESELAFDSLQTPDLQHFDKMEQELASLAKKWNKQTSVSNADRMRIHLIAQDNQKLLEQVCLLYEEVLLRIEKRSKSTSESLRSLKAGRTVLIGYRIDRPGDPWFIDKKI